MSSSILEVLRTNHELSESYETAIGEELDQRPNGQKAKVWQQHRLKAIAEKVVACNQELLSLTLDADGTLQEELQAMRSNPLDSFYRQFHSTLEYYEKFPGLQFLSSSTPDALSIALEEELKEVVAFSGEEVFGKYLDLNPLFLQFANVLKSVADKDKDNKPVVIEQDYLQYLDRFNSFFYLPEAVKQKTSYLEYLQALWEYLRGFYTRVHPLIDLESVIKEWEKEFHAKVAAKEIVIKGVNTSTANAKKEPQPLRLGMFNDVQELEALGLERLKEALDALGLKCGGTLSDRANRLWAVRGKKLEDIPANLKAKPVKKNSSGAEGGKEKIIEKVALCEFLITSLCDVMGDIVSATRRHAEKQQARSVEEKEQELFEEEYGLVQEKEVKPGADDEDEAPIYNPLNIPLGWDGKPIPYWLYKLHGLGVEYKCEICGNFSYWGRRAFDKHFQEWRHAHGMRCLGVPNTKHFHDITSIQQVVSLYEKIKDSLQREQYVGDFEEEFEDSQGNVLNRRTYEDLARQGLL